jgi:uncharacterized protein
MAEPASGSTTDSSAASPPSGWKAALQQNRWAVFLLPFLVYMLSGVLDPTPDHPGGQWLGLAIPYSAYPLLYTLKIALTLAAIVLVLPGYREFPLRVSPLAIIFGASGVVVWVALATLGWEKLILDAVAPEWLRNMISERPAFDPFQQIADPRWAWAFLVVRFIGLALVVPFVEEAFLRGFAMRFVMAADWWKVPFGKVTPAAVAVGTILPMLSHPELLAAAVWFSMITWLMVRTRNFWDCVVAHAVTNLLLGIYVVWQGAWTLW